LTEFKILYVKNTSLCYICGLGRSQEKYDEGDPPYDSDSKKSITVSYTLSCIIKRLQSILKKRLFIPYRRVYCM